ncbi:addiction module toxin, RelE/StbE family [Coriobacteriaceae bacterium BV3Ac1]|uniref:type II toxin-antitoxin system RelE/ParE family toxin n=2 Tax=Olegusella massiliensis TaxID=1776381 RepID=UPI0003ADE146|nr:type II toxin-antitoxin system YafQ family toxin [Olegusella massiliensis]ERL13169.1 addiction module toxin, RelE/StbE family [Coriobacteriaceae bacterium BV3Ac1]
MLQLQTTVKFRKDYKRIKKRGLDISLLQDILDRLCARKTLDAKYRDHALTGPYVGFRECHIQPDWLLIYAVNESNLILVASRTGSHADLFNM